jgi:hypothetical protein
VTEKICASRIAIAPNALVVTLPGCSTVLNDDACAGDDTLWRQFFIRKWCRHLSRWGRVIPHARLAANEGLAEGSAEYAGQTSVRKAPIRSCGAGLRKGDRRCAEEFRPPLMGSRRRGTLVKVATLANADRATAGQLFPYEIDVREQHTNSTRTAQESIRASR